MTKKNATKKTKTTTVSYVIRNNNVLLYPLPSELADVLSDDHLKLLVTILNSHELTPRAKIKRLRSDIFAYYDNIQLVNLDTAKTPVTTPVSETAKQTAVSETATPVSETAKTEASSSSSFVQRFTVENPLVIPNPLSKNPDSVLELVEAPVFKDPVKYVTHFVVIFKTSSENVEELRNAPKSLAQLVSLYECTNTAVLVKLSRDEHMLPVTDVCTAPIDYLHYRKIYPMKQTYDAENNTYVYEYDKTRFTAHFVPMMLKSDYLRYLKRKQKQNS